MKKGVGPVKDFSQIQAGLEALRADYPRLDFDDTATTFAHLSDAELKRSAYLFTLMNKPWLTNLLAGAGLKAVAWGLPGAAWLVKQTIYPQFVGGTSLVATEPTIERLWSRGVASVLDYGAEAKETEQDFNATMKEVLRGIEFAARNQAVPVVSTKISGMARFGLLEELQAQHFIFTPETRQEYDSVLKRLDAICSLANKKGVKIFFDAEESWIQDTLDQMVAVMMRRYNKARAIVYNTFQMYRHDRLAYLMASYEQAQQQDYILGAKLVRGAYMEKERQRAKEKGYPSPIQPDLRATHAAFNEAIQFCIEHYETMASCNASHNRSSVELQVNLIAAKQLDKKHEHLNFCQLYGMSDNLTFNLAAGGYNVAKYLVYGPVKEVTPYLIRRAQENTSVTGDMSRELALLRKEMDRRKL